MANINNGGHPQGLRGLMRDFVAQWVTSPTIHGRVVESRDFAMDLLIRPWLRKANSDPSLNVTISNWQSIWNNTPEADLRKYAPFRLSAIVNRIDVRASTAYTSGVGNAGETRFIFSLIDPYTGAIPISPNQSASQNSNGVGFVDWRGLNVIFEYANVQTTRCGLKDYALQWLNLSDPAHQFGTPAQNNSYKIALQAITDQVTAANAKPGNVNGSALARIRTNEKAFATIRNIEIHAAWELQDWEFRQLELDGSTHSLKLVPLTNNPPHTANHAPNIQETYTSPPNPVGNGDILNWIFSGHKHQVLNGNFNLPDNLNDISGIVRREQAQYFDFSPSLFASAGGYNVNNPSEEAKRIRHQLSLNTCAGCHAGETKTVFAHINPLNNTDPAKYWGGYIGRRHWHSPGPVLLPLVR